MQRFQTTSPSDGRTLSSYAYAKNAEIEKALASSVIAYSKWRSLKVRDRAAHFAVLADLLARDATSLARNAADEMGKPLAQGIKEVEKCAHACRHFSLNGSRFLEDEVVGTELSKSSISLSPLGTILCIMPWNFPYWQVIRFAIPALLAGNTVVMKHADNVAGCALALTSLFQKAGVPDGVFQNLFIEHATIKSVIRDPRVAAITLTGSERAGAAVAEEAGKSLKKCVLELGGSDPYLILEDADIDLAAQVSVEARLVNAGQSCVAAKRFIAVAGVYDLFRDKMVALLERKKIGGPHDGATDVGPLAKKEGVLNLDRQVRESIARGARLLIGGKRRESPGNFYEITALDGVGPGMPAFDEETFGPVAAIIRAKDEADALRLANASRYGLGAAIFTRDMARAEMLAREKLDAGIIAINGQVASDPRLPFGGVKLSGYGRELGVAGLREFVNVKTINVF